MRELAEQSRKSNVLFTRQGRAGKAERSQQVRKANRHFSRADTHKVSKHVNGTRQSHPQRATTQAPGLLERGGQTMTSAGEDVRAEP